MSPAPAPPRLRGLAPRPASRVLAVVLGLVPALVPAQSVPATGTRFAVTSGDTAASEAGLEVLRAGGDVVDAAIATMAALGVTTPQSSGLGGGCFVLVHRAAEGRTYVLDAREVAPARARPELYLDATGAVVSSRSRIGGLAVAVPGEVAGFAALHARFGKLPWDRLFVPAARLAREGFTVGTELAQATVERRTELARFAPIAALYLPGGRPLAAGERRTNPDLAATLEALGAKGPDWFYRGAMARELVAAVAAGGGVLSAEDLAGYRPVWRDPVELRFRGQVIRSMPPPSSGGTVLAEILGLLEPMPLEALGWNSPAYLHRLAEAMKHGFADRARYMGDPAFVRVPVDALLAPAYLGALRARIHPLRAAGAAAFEHELPAGAFAVLAEDGGTSHVGVVDRDGNAVAATTTVNEHFGSLQVVPGRGLVLNDEMDDFSLAAGAPNAFGLVGGAANAIRPGKKPLSSMSPTLVLEGGQVVLVAGAAGGPRIISGTLQAILATRVFGVDVATAVAAPRIHHQWSPDRLRVEARFPPGVAAALRARGHAVEVVEEPGSRVNVLARHPDRIEGAADPRKGSRAVAE